jgi:zinc protease
VEEQIADTKKTTLDDVKKFYKDFYGASNAQIVVVGDFNPAEIQKLASGLLAGWKSPAAYTRISRDYRKIAPANQTIETPDKANSMFTAGMPLNVGEAHPDYAALTLANYMLGGHSTSRLYVRIRGKDGLSYSVNSMLSADARDPRADWMMFAIANPVNVAKLQAAFQEEMEKAVKEGFTTEELAAAKKGWLQSRNVARSQDGALASRLLSNEREGRTMAFDAELEKKVSALTVAEVNDAWRRHMDLSQISIVTAGDFKKGAAPAAK